MLMAYLTLFSGLFISAVAIYYSVSGLTAIFAASVIPIIIMGTSLEVGKLVASVWLKQYWNEAPKLLRGYLLTAVAILMLITSMGIFGYLSKAHTDQSLVSGDVQSKIAVYDEKIKTEKDNIDVNRKSLKQMDEAVDQVMARSTTEGGADKAVAIRRSQQKERARILADITASQTRITSLNELRAPIAAEVRKVEAEVGPIKYIAAFIYGDNPDDNVLEKAVRWVIILIVIVFDPLAVILLLASQYSFEFERKKRNPESPPPPDDVDWDTLNATLHDIKEDRDQALEEFFERAREVAEQLDAGTYQAPEEHPFRGKGLHPSMPMTASYVQPKVDEPQYEADDGPLTDEQIEQIRETVKNDLPTGEVISKESLFEEMPKAHLVARDMGGGYVSVDGHVYHHQAYDASSKSSKDLVERLSRPDDYNATEDTYVQNEEQKDSGGWSKIAGTAITEEEYLEAARKRQKDNDVK